MNPLTGALMGAGTAALIGQIVPEHRQRHQRHRPGRRRHLEIQLRVAGAGRRAALRRRLRRHRAADAGRQRGGVGLFFDRPDGDSIYYQSQNPPTSTNQTVRNGLLQRSGRRYRRGAAPACRR